MRHRRIDGPLRGAPLVSQRPFGDSTDRAGCPEWVLSTRLPFGACHTGGWCSTYWVMSGGASGRDRSKEVFEQLYDRVARRLLVYLTRRMHDVDAATELWAECWAVAFEGWPRCNAASASEADAWVFGIARNQLAGYYRSGAIKHRAGVSQGLCKAGANGASCLQHKKRRSLSSELALICMAPAASRQASRRRPL